MPTFEETRHTSDGYVHTFYKGSCGEQDEAAIRDLWEYIDSLNARDQLNGIIAKVETGENTIVQLNFWLGYIGVTGRPFHALCRKHLLDKYREWMHSEPDAVETDEYGFTIK